MKLIAFSGLQILRRAGIYLGTGNGQQHVRQVIPLSVNMAFKDIRQKDTHAYSMGESGDVTRSPPKLVNYSPLGNLKKQCPP